MDDILASIRRILSDEDKSPKPSASGVLMLEPSMMVDAPDLSAAGETGHKDQAMDEQGTIAEQQDAAAPPTRPVENDLPEQHAAAAPLEPAPGAISEPPEPPGAHVANADSEASLVAPEAAEAAAISVGALIRTLAQERNAAVNRGGPTIEDIVREQIRPLLKGWLDAHLPGLVERLVKAEIERVVGRITG